MTRKEVNLQVLDQSIDTGDATGRLLFNMLGAIAQFETEIRAERQMDGIHKAKERGVRFGRKKSLTDGADCRTPDAARTRGAHQDVDEGLQHIQSNLLSVPRHWITLKKSYGCNGRAQQGRFQLATYTFRKSQNRQLSTGLRRLAVISNVYRSQLSFLQSNNGSITKCTTATWENPTLELARSVSAPCTSGGVTPEDEAHAIMDKALEMGINFFDTANVYGGAAGTGATESVIGRWFAQGGGRRDQVVLATKTYNAMNRPAIPGDPNDDRGVSVYKVRRDLAASLRRLQTDRIDLYQVHHIDRRVRLEEFWGALGQVLDSGDVLYVGTSNFPGWGLTKFQTFARRQGRLGFISEQCQYNLLNRYPELEVIPAAQDSGIGLFPYMPLAGGLLTGKMKAAEGSRTSAVEQEYGLELGSEQFTAWSDLCREIGEPEFVVAIAWVLANPVVSSAIVGVRTLRHLDGLERAAELNLDEDMMAKLDVIFDINSQRPLKMGPAPEAFAW